MALRDFIDTSRAASKFAVEGGALSCNLYWIFALADMRPHLVETERLYGKDAACPKEWSEWLKSSSLPAHVLPNHTDNMLNALPESVRGQNLNLLCVF